MISKLRGLQEGDLLGRARVLDYPITRPETSITRTTRYPRIVENRYPKTTRYPKSIPAGTRNFPKSLEISEK